MCILKEEESGQESGTSDHVWYILGVISSIALRSSQSFECHGETIWAHSFSIKKPLSTSTTHPNGICSRIFVTMVCIGSLIAPGYPSLIESFQTVPMADKPFKRRMVFVGVGRV
jgi:hypothetical protein